MPPSSGRRGIREVLVRSGVAAPCHRYEGVGLGKSPWLRSGVMGSSSHGSRSYLGALLSVEPQIIECAVLCYARSAMLVLMKGCCWIGNALLPGSSECRFFALYSAEAEVYSLEDRDAALVPVDARKLLPLSLGRQRCGVSMLAEIDAGICGGCDAVAFRIESSWQNAWATRESPGSKLP
ncbi:hypothetical protein Nepgr_026682 [Nepenthes gracilis]|uniref:Uncharacterized protein n=1 Tax=Nepenthes gracilis TaxID=150966 RepID=A0AAD3Y2B6_NEPGR|nr:hypothetical protein Nepgr_026682 [Nepenthes gracilis]